MFASIAITTFDYRQPNVSRCCLMMATINALNYLNPFQIT